MDKKIWIRGAGDLATGIALRLFRSGFDVIMSDIDTPTEERWHFPLQYIIKRQW